MILHVINSLRVRLLICMHINGGRAQRRTVCAGTVEIRKIQKDWQEWLLRKYIITKPNLTAIERVCLSEVIGPANADLPDPLSKEASCNLWNGKACVSQLWC